mgnify:FL=1
MGNSWTQRVVFIIGAPRSGTTLVYRMLVRNQPQISGSEQESRWFSRQIWEPYTLQRALENSYVQGLLEEEAIRSIYARSRDWAEFFREMVRHKLRSTTAAFFVEKTPAQTLCIRRIRRRIPECQFLVVWRQAGAVIHSMVVTPWIGLRVQRLPGSLWPRFLAYWEAASIYCAYWWKIRELWHRDARSVVLRYEDIVRQKINLREFFREWLGVELGELFISRPFSAEVEHRHYELDESRCDAYCEHMPLWVRKVVEFTFPEPSVPARAVPAVARWILFGLPANALRLWEAIGRRRQRAGTRSPEN